MKRIGVGAALCLGLLAAGCAGGRLSDRPILFEAPATGAAGNQPLRQTQVDLLDLIKSSRVVRSAGFNPDDPFPPLEGEIPTTNYNGHPVANRIGKERRKLDRLLLLVAHSYDETGKQELRNTVAGRLIGASDANCQTYLQGLRISQVSSRTAADILATGFGIAGSLTSPLRTANLLSSIGAFATAAGASTDRNIFAQQGVEIIADSIVRDRAREKTTLLRKFDLTYEKWPLPLVLVDLYDYHDRCSLLRGFGQAQEAVRARDAAVRTARLAQAKALSKDATLAAVLATVGEAADDPGGAGLAGSDVPSAPPAYRGLDKAFALGADCLAATVDGMLGATGREGRRQSPEEVKAVCARRGDTPWGDQFAAIISTAVANLPPTDKSDASVRALLAAADKIQGALEERRARILGLRRTALDKARIMGENGAAADVVALLQGDQGRAATVLAVGAPAPPPPDPFFDYILVQLAGPPAQSSGAAAAESAEAVARGFGQAGLL